MGKKTSMQPILSLRPTQFCIGVDEVEAKVERLMKLSEERRLKFLMKRTVPIVVSPHGHFYLIDRHHLAFTCWLCGVKNLKVKIIADYSATKLSKEKFWHEMGKRRWCHLYDQFGDGPRNPLYLPRDVRGLADDPYRSLAWMVRQKKGYRNSQIPFAEFRWAKFFRRRNLLNHNTRDELKLAVPEALRLARSKGAKWLPGFKGESRGA